MADVATRSLNSDDVLRHRLTEIYVTDGTDKLWRVDSLRFKLAVTAFENPPNVDSEPLEDGSEIEEVTSTTAMIEFSISDLNEADVATINGSTVTDIGWVTSTGGANGTGRDCKLETCDTIYAYIQDAKLMVRGKKRVSGTTLPFTFTDNAAA